MSGALETNPQYGTARAGANLSADAYLLMVDDGAGSIIRATGAAARLLGVLGQDAGEGAAGDRVQLGVDGQLRVIAGAALAQGDTVTSDGVGRAIPTSLAGQHFVGHAVNIVAAAGEVAIVQIDRGITHA